METGPSKCMKLHLLEPGCQEVAKQCTKHREGEHDNAMNKTHQEQICDLDGLIVACAPRNLAM